MRALRQLGKATFNNRRTRKSNLQQPAKSIHDGVKYSCEFCEYKENTCKTISKGGSRQVHVKYIHDRVKHSCEFYD